MSAPDPIASPAGERILAHLRGQWDDAIRLTTVTQAQAALGLDPDVALRRRLGRSLFDHPEIHPAVACWGAPALALTEDETLLGRYLAGRAPGGSGRCTFAEAAAALGRGPEEVEEGLSTLAALDLLTWERDGQAARFRFADDLTARLGPLGWMSHTVEVEGEGAFNVP
jgi:hypothetical protein